MNFLTKAADFIGGSLFKEIKEGIMAYFPPDMTPQQKAEMELKVNEMLNEKQLKANQILNDAAAQLDERIAEQEGTAKDLKTIPVLGAIMIFLRGCQRPIWGFATLYMDWLWLFKHNIVASATQIVFTPQQEIALTVINLLVLGFLFGERTVKNLEPLILKMTDKIFNK